MKILVVEDQEEIAAVLKKRLEEEYYAVDVESDGDRGLYRAKTNDYDLILLDNGLPGKEGHEICSGLREYKITTPIMILSVQCELDTKVMLLNCGADDYLTKPYSFVELSARIKALLRRPHTIEDPLLVVKGISLNRETCSFIKNNENIYVTPKEFMLLEYLMRNSGKVVSRAMILEHVWDDNADAFSNSLEMHIMNLRRKLDSDGGDSFIKTMSGRGYMI